MEPECGMRSLPTHFSRESDMNAKSMPLARHEGSLAVHLSDPLLDAIDELGELVLAQYAQINVQKAQMSAQQACMEGSALQLTSQLRSLKRALQ